VHPSRQAAAAKEVGNHRSDDDERRTHSGFNEDGATGAERDQGEMGDGEGLTERHMAAGDGLSSSRKAAGIVQATAVNSSARG
jgi:hypothetical protein